MVFTLLFFFFTILLAWLKCLLKEAVINSFSKSSDSPNFFFKMQIYNFLLRQEKKNPATLITAVESCIPEKLPVARAKGNNTKVVGPLAQWK